jgi:hypothetical protein
MSSKIMFVRMPRTSHFSQHQITRTTAEVVADTPVFKYEAVTNSGLSEIGPGDLSYIIGFRD